MVSIDAEEAVDTVEAIRAANNHLWMDLLRIALEADPDKTKAILRKINANDQRISSWLKRLAE